MRGIPIFAISIAVKKNKEIIASSIFDPNRDEFFFAEKRKGAYLNDRRTQLNIKCPDDYKMAIYQPHCAHS